MVVDFLTFMYPKIQNRRSFSPLLSSNVLL